GVPAGLGEPVFDKLDAELAKAMLSVGAVKGIEFGAGFSAADLCGSVNNDRMHAENGKAVFDTNNAGGILGGISNGNDIVFRVAVKPVPSIFQAQNTVCRKDGVYESTELQIKGRHDVCLCPRIVPVIEAMTDIVLADMLLRN
ncbi:chorismate synthase, partial [Treponema porcinum]